MYHDFRFFRFFNILSLLFILYASMVTALVTKIKKPVNGKLEIHTKFFAKIPDFDGKPSQIMTMEPLAGDLYVTTGPSGGIIYKVTQNGFVSPWFNVAKAMQENGRPMNTEDMRHGGIRSIAFHPTFSKSGKFYISAVEKRPKKPDGSVYFSDPIKPVDANSVLLEFTYSHRMKKVLAMTYRVVLRIGLIKFDHPIKQIAFQGNYLLIGHGDGSEQSATVGGGQGNDGLGKILRINPLKSGSKPYSVPASNPFVRDKRWKDELYAVGFRNPHTICISKKYGIFVADAGRDNVDEINIVKAGRNYGWEEREGTYVHLKDSGGGYMTSIKDLPPDDAKYGFTYPNAQVPHNASRGKKFAGQAIAGGCPVENGSPLNGIFIYTNFPTDGQVYYSQLSSLTKAIVQGPPKKLTQAIVYRAKIRFDDDSDPRTPPVLLENLLEVVRRDGAPKWGRADVRFGRGSGGELYWSTKATGKIYLITNTRLVKK